MKVLIDSSLFPTRFSSKSGHGRIWHNLFQRLPLNIEAFCNSRIRELPAPLRKRLRWAPVPILRPYRIGYRIADFTSRLIDRFESLNLLAPSHFIMQEETRRLAQRIPLVTILDDLTPELVPGTMPQWLVPKRRALELATIIIAISESTKQLAMEYYKMPSEKFRVAPLASDIVRPDMALSVRPHEQPYLLVVGNRQGYKNFDVTLRAFGQVACKTRDVSLLLAGPELADFEQTRIHELDLTKRVHYAGRPDDSTLAALYAHAVALIYPSLSEGFGIPPLEAMICGTVPVVSNRTSMPEVVGDAGIQIDPTDDEALSNAMLSLLGNASLRNRLVERGLERSKRFSWDRTTDLIFAAWREVARC